jgi:hypothetical protein
VAICRRGIDFVKFTDSGLNRSHFSKKAMKKQRKFLCQFCARAKMTHRSFADKNWEKDLVCLSTILQIYLCIIIYLYYKRGVCITIYVQEDQNMSFVWIEVTE